MKYLLYIIFLNIIFTESSNNLEKEFSYNGNWPINNNKNIIIENSNTNKIDCPNGVGCECVSDGDCINSNV